MKLNDAFPSKYLKADDISEGSDVTLTVKDLDIQPIKNQDGKDESKPVMNFRDKSHPGLPAVKPIILNKTNWKAIEKAYGPDSDDWIGKPVTLFVMDVDAFGETKPAIRIKIPKAGPKSAVTIDDLKARYFERANEAAQLGILAPTIPDDATAEQIVEAGKALKSAIDKANEF